MKRKKKKKSGWLGVKCGAWRMLSVAMLAGVCLGAGQARAVAHEWTVVLAVEKSGASRYYGLDWYNLDLAFSLLQTNASGQTSKVSSASITVKDSAISSNGGFTAQVVFNLPDGFDPADGVMSISFSGSQKQLWNPTKSNTGTWTSDTIPTWTPEALQALLTGRGTSSGIFSAADYAINVGGTSVRATPEPSGAMVLAVLASALALRRRRRGA